MMMRHQARRVQRHRRLCLCGLCRSLALSASQAPQAKAERRSTYR